MKVWKQVGVFLVSWWIIGAILSLLIGWIAGFIGITCAVLIVMRLRKKYPNAVKQAKGKENKRLEDSIKETKRQYIAEHGKKAYKKVFLPELKKGVKEEVKWKKQNVKIQDRDFKDAEKKRREGIIENYKAEMRDRRKYLTYTQKLKLNSMTYTHTPDEIEKIAQDWIAENKKKEIKGGGDDE